MSEEVIGIHAVTALLENPQAKVKQIFLVADRKDKRIANLQSLAYERCITMTQLTKQEFNQRFRGQHQGVVALIEKLPQLTEQDIPQLLQQAGKNPLVLILDGITDPHNLGACLRSSEAAGVNFVVIPKDNSVGLTAVVRKVASGSAERIPLVSVTNLSRTMKQLQDAGVWIFGAAGETDNSIYQCDFNGPVAIVMGAEGKGMRRLTRENCDYLFSLPMQGQIESLNVSVATGIGLYEVMRQRLN